MRKSWWEQNWPITNATYNIGHNDRSPLDNCLKPLWPGWNITYTGILLLATFKCTTLKKGWWFSQTPAVGAENRKTWKWLIQRPLPHIPIYLSVLAKGKSGMVSTTKSGQQTRNCTKPKIKRLESQYTTDFKEETGTGTSYQISHPQYLQR